MNIDPKAAELLRQAFNLTDSRIRMIERSDPDVLESPDLIPKLTFLTEHFPPCGLSKESAVSLASRSFFRISYEEFLLCASIPDRMGFTEKERKKYNDSVLDWKLPEDFGPLKPILARLGGEALADEIVRNLNIPAARVGYDGIRAICERLLSYPVPISPEWFGESWSVLFSLYSDPIRILDELDLRFRPEHVAEVFMSDPGWSRIGYGLGGGLVAEMRLHPRYADEKLAEAEERFAAYRL